MAPKKATEKKAPKAKAKAAAEKVEKEVPAGDIEMKEEETAVKKEIKTPRPKKNAKKASSAAGEAKSVDDDAASVKSFKSAQSKEDVKKEEEVKKGDVVKKEEEVKKEDVKKEEEVKKEGVKKEEEVKKEDVKEEEVKKEDAKEEEVKKEDVKEKEEVKKEAGDVTMGDASAAPSHTTEEAAPKTTSTGEDVIMTEDAPPDTNKTMEEGAEVKEEGLKEEAKKEGDATMVEGENNAVMEEKQDDFGAVMEEAPAMEEEPKEEEPKEKELDEVETTEARYKDPIRMSTEESTLNALVSPEGIVTSLQMDTFHESHQQAQHLLAACKMNVGLIAGRYMLETEILVSGNGGEVRLGFSTPKSTLFLGENGTIGVVSNGSFFSDGNIIAPLDFGGRRFSRGDVIGLLLNRTESGNANTLSLFHNGERMGQPQPLPESFLKQALFPHVTVKNCTVFVNSTNTLLKRYPFTCRSIGGAAKKHIVPSSVKDTNESEIVVPVGYFSPEWLESYQASRPNDTFTELTQSFLSKWQGKSLLQEAPPSIYLVKFFEKMMRQRKRKFVYSFGHNLNPIERKAFCERMPPQMKKTAVVHDPAIEELPTHNHFTPLSRQAENGVLPPATPAPRVRRLPDCKAVGLPSEEEGFQTVSFTESREKSQDLLKKWQKKTKDQTRVDNLQPGNWFRQKMESWRAFQEETRKDGEETKLQKMRERAAQEEEEGEKKEGEAEKKEGEAEKKDGEAEKKEGEAEKKEGEAEKKECEAEKKEGEAEKKEGEAEKKEGEEKKEEREEEKKEEKKKPRREGASCVDTSTWTEEDWMLVDLRVELHLLCHAFRMDVDDEERTRFSGENLNHYYRLYNGPKSFYVATYGAKTVEEVFEPVTDTITLEEDMVTPKLEQDTEFDVMMELTESARQERTDRIGAGDEGAKLKFKAMPRQQQQQQQQRNRGYSNIGGGFQRDYQKGGGFQRRDGSGFNRGDDRNDSYGRYPQGMRGGHDRDDNRGRQYDDYRGRRDDDRHGDGSSGYRGGKGGNGPSTPQHHSMQSRPQTSPQGGFHQQGMGGYNKGGGSFGNKGGNSNFGHNRPNFGKGGGRDDYNMRPLPGNVGGMKRSMPPQSGGNMGYQSAPKRFQGNQGGR